MNILYVETSNPKSFVENEQAQDVVNYTVQNLKRLGHKATFFSSLNSINKTHILASDCILASIPQGDYVSLWRLSQEYSKGVIIIPSYSEKFRFRLMQDKDGTIILTRPHRLEQLAQAVEFACQKTVLSISTGHARIVQ